MSHTRGPWSLMWIYGALRHINRNVDEEYFYDKSHDPQCECNTPNALINEGDAHLIAAAPDLLDALKSVVSSCAETGSNVIDGSVLDRINAIVAKAEGVKP